MLVVLLQDDPIIGRVISVSWETAGAPIGINTVAAGGWIELLARRGMCGAEIIAVSRIVAVRMIEDNIGRRRRECNRAREVDLLPTARGFIVPGLIGCGIGKE